MPPLSCGKMSIELAGKTRLGFMLNDPRAAIFGFRIVPNPSIEMKELFARKLKATDALIIAVIVAALGGLGYLGYGLLHAKLVEARIDKAIPQVVAAIREEGRQLETAIEAYKARLGVYPPDHVISRNPMTVDAVTNQLLYELAGTIFVASNKIYQAEGHQAVQAAMIKQLFNADRFLNSSEQTNKVHCFLTPEFASRSREIHDDPDVDVLSFPSLPEGLDLEAALQFEISSWRYVSSAPKQNPGRFDLWTEMTVKNKKRVIGNWSAKE